MNTILDSQTGMKVVQLPAWEDNYIYILSFEDKAWVIDPTLAEPVQKYLQENNLELQAILNTHHHPDHVGGNSDLVSRWSCDVYGLSEDAKRIPHITHKIDDGDSVDLGPCQGDVIFIPVNTLGHIAYYLKEPGWLFSGDTLFSLGCGRLFEGTPQQMHTSLNKICQLPEDTLVFCSHEYTEANLDFSLSLMPDDPSLKRLGEMIREKRKQNRPTVPMELSQEKACNLFLRWGDFDLRKSLNLEAAEDWQVFAKVRELKDNF